MRKILGTPPPDKAARSVLPIRWPKLGEPIVVTLLEEAPFGLELDVVTDPGTGKTVNKACGLPGLCVWHDKAIRFGWAGFVGCWSHKCPEMCIVPFTRDGWAQLCDRLIDLEPARGTKWLVERGGKKPQGPYVLTRETASFGMKGMPVCPDIRPSLRNLYGDVAQLRPREADLSDEQGGAS